MYFEITYQDSWDDCDVIHAEEDEFFRIPGLDGASGQCGGGEIFDDDDEVVEDEICLYRGVSYVLRGDTLYAVNDRREVPWDEFVPPYDAYEW